MKRTYNELIALELYEDRLKYLMLHGKTGEDTFGFDRWMNQKFYQSKEWHEFRNFIIARDGGCDLAHPDHPAIGKVRIIVHHLNPLTKEQIENGGEELFDPQNAVSVFMDTHNLIHYGNKTPDLSLKDRHPNDTCPWKGVNTNG